MRPNQRTPAAITLCAPTSSPPPAPASGTITLVSPPAPPAALPDDWPHDDRQEGCAASNPATPSAPTQEKFRQLRARPMQRTLEEAARAHKRSGRLPRAERDPRDYRAGVERLLHGVGLGQLLRQTRAQLVGVARDEEDPDRRVARAQLARDIAAGAVGQ